LGRGRPITNGQYRKKERKKAPLKPDFPAKTDSTWLGDALVVSQSSSSVHHGVAAESRSDAPKQNEINPACQ
jgi:hypothetical protein